MPVQEATPRQIGRTVAEEYGRSDECDDVIIGHRLTDGQFYVHRPCEPCGECDRRAAGTHRA